VAIAHPYRTLVLATLVFVASLGSTAFIATEFMPVEDRGEFDVAVDLAPGTSFDESVRTVAGIEKQVLALPEVRQVFTEVGVEGETRKSVLRVKTSKKDQRERGIGQIKEDLRGRLAGVPFADIRVMNPPFMQGTPNEAPIQVFVRGDDLKELQRVSDELVRRARQIPGARDVSSTLVSGQPEMVARIRRSTAADMGFSVGAVAMQLRGMVEGIVASKFRDAEKQYDIRLRLAPEYRNDFAAIARAPLYSPTGSAIRTSDIVTMESGVGPARIQREQRRRQARIGIDISGRALGDVTADVQKAIADMKVPGTFEIGFQGDVDLMQETMRNIGLALLLAVAFIYIVLASQFESFLEPLIIMLSLPFAIVGALLLLLATRQHLGMPAMIGIVMLMGLVTKNAILLVDYTNQLRRKENLSLEEALLKAGPVRLRPILMTTMAMILGMLPAAFGLGEGGEFRAPMSLATIGGLVTSTLLTLVLVPVAYLLTGRLTEKVRSWRQAPTPVIARAARVAGILLVLGLLGAVFAVSRAYAAPQAEPRTAAGGQDQAMALTFDEALKYALEHNETLKVGRERVVESQSRVAEARAGFLPQIDLNFLYTPEQEFPRIRIPAGVFGPNELSFSAAFTRQNILRLDLTQPIYTGGRLREAYRIRAVQMEESGMQQERSEQTLKLQVIQAFYAALLNEQGRQVAEEGVQLAENHVALAKARFDAGTAARLDVLRTEVELANARARLIRMKASVQVAYQTLRTVLSLPSGTRFRLEGRLADGVTVPARAELLAAVAARPDVRAVRAQKEMAERSMAIAIAETKPSAALTANLQYQQDGFSSLLQNQNRSFQVGFVFRVPLFAAPGAMARRAVASAQVKQAEHGRRAMLQAGALEVESAYSELEATIEIVATQEKALEMAREGLSIAEVSYQSGVITASELNDAKVALLTTEWELAQAKYGRIVAAAKTRYAAGLI
jgi:outer membrane protein TolC/preprotein translocase subunit SecF